MALWSDEVVVVLLRSDDSMQVPPMCSKTQKMSVDDEVTFLALRLHTFAGVVVEALTDH